MPFREATPPCAHAWQWPTRTTRVGCVWLHGRATVVGAATHACRRNTLGQPHSSTQAEDPPRKAHLVGIVHEAAAAARVLISVAVHELLLAQRLELASHDRVDALHTAGGGERPARAALPLRTIDKRGRGACDEAAPQAAAGRMRPAGGASHVGGRLHALGVHPRPARSCSAPQTRHCHAPPTHLQQFDRAAAVTQASPKVHPGLLFKYREMSLPGSSLRTRRSSCASRSRGAADPRPRLHSGTWWAAARSSMLPGRRGCTPGGP